MEALQCKVERELQGCVMFFSNRRYESSSEAIFCTFRGGYSHPHPLEQWIEDKSLQKLKPYPFADFEVNQFNLTCKMMFAHFKGMLGPLLETLFNEFLLRQTTSEHQEGPQEPPPPQNCLSLRGAKKAPGRPSQLSPGTCNFRNGPKTLNISNI